MSLELALGTQPEKLTAKATEAKIYLGDYILSMTDLLCLTEYALTNSHLVDPVDVRLHFLERIATLKSVPGNFPGWMQLRYPPNEHSFRKGASSFHVSQSREHPDLEIDWGILTRRP